MTIQGLGRFGVWRHYAGVTPEDVGVLESLGYSALWLGGSPPAALDMIDPLLEETENLIIGTSIVNVWSAPAKETAESFHRIDERFPGRFILGVGIGHPEHTSVYRKPYDALVDYLDALDEGGVPQGKRALTAPGSDRLIDALAPHGTADTIGAALTEHLTAGADQVAIQPLGDDYLTTLRALAPVLA
jgi:alkanesulfonate monooxygenase SsuD/methylene tetrahydromethanopterin reductase-like flavin-dependent oxidoreductase (luciferase family)